MKKSPLFILLVFLGLPVLAQNIPLQPVAVSEAGRNVDSMAVWIAPKIADSLVLVTEKAGGQLMVLKADKTATLVKRFGDMKRPNAIVIVPSVRFGRKNRDLAFVTERDANLVSVYSLPDLEKVGEFANDVPAPMGISIYRHKNELLAFVVAKRAEGNDKVVRFRLVEKDGKLSGVHETQFGKELTPNQETVYVDEKRKLVFVADETAQNIKIYDLNGNLQKSFGDGVFQAQVEGIAVVRCKKTDYLIASDQLDTTEFEIFDLKDLRHVGMVVTAAKHTDGIAVNQSKLKDFPNGIFISQSDPEGTGGRQAEFYDLKAFFAKANLICR